MTTDMGSALSVHRESYVAVVSPDDVGGLVRDLHDLGLESGAIDVFEDADAESAELVPERVESGSLTGFVRRVFGFDQVEVERGYVKALEAGDSVLRVRVPEDDDETRAAVERALLRHDARFIHYFGKWSYVEIASDADRAGDRTT